MRNKLVPLFAIGTVLLLIGLLVYVLLFGGSGEVQTPDSGDPFGDTSGERPFGDTSGEREPINVSELLGSQGETVPVLRLLSDEPVAGVGTQVRDNGGVPEPYARYTLSGQGHVLDIPLSRMAAATTTSLTTVPGVLEALWSSNASSTVYRYLGQDDTVPYTWLGSLALPDGSREEVAPYELVGEFLADEPESVAFSPRGDAVFYTVLDPEGGTRGYVQTLATGAKRQVWRSPLREISAHWTSPDHIVIHTLPSQVALGFAWQVSLSSGVAEQILNETVALTALGNSTGELVLFSTLEGKLPSLRVLDLATKAVRFVPLVTLPEKCVWSRLATAVMYCAVPKNTPGAKDYPEGWYQGSTRFSDSLWKINTETGETNLLAEPEKLLEVSLDALDLKLTPDEAYLVFRSRGDDLLWSLTLPAPAPQATSTDATTL